MDNQEQLTGILNEGRRTTSISLSVSDYNFVKLKGLMFSQLLHDKISEERAVSDGTILNSIQSQNKKIESLQARFQAAINYINKKELIDDYLRENG